MPFITPSRQLEPSATQVEQAHSAPGEREVWPEPVKGGTGALAMALVRFLIQSDVHTYAFSVAANVILALFPFIVLLLTMSRVVFHSPAMVTVVSELMHNFLPTGQDFVMRNMNLLVHPNKGVKILSVIMLLISSTGVFLPLEVALNNVWRAPGNRNYLHNQVVSLGLALAVGLLAMISVAASTAQRTLLGLLFFGHTDNIFYNGISQTFLTLVATVAAVLIFFLIYWLLPNRRIPVRAVLPTAIVVGILWQVSRYIYVLVLPHLDLANAYGPFQISVGLMLWAFVSGLMLLAGAHFSATRYAMLLAAKEAVKEQEAS